MSTQLKLDESQKVWQPGLLRVTAFYSVPLDLRTVDWWERLTGHPSETRNVRSGTGQLLEEGTVDGRLFRLVVQPARVDWLLLPVEEEDGSLFSLLGNFEECTFSFTKLVSEWFEQAPALTRLAFGTQLFIPTADQGQALRIIADLLPHVKIDWRGAENFLLQINRPQPCETLPGQWINRLAKYETVVRRNVVALLSVEGQTSRGRIKEETAACYELDLSTKPQINDNTLPRERLRDLLAELVRSATNLVSKERLL